MVIDVPIHEEIETEVPLDTYVTVPVKLVTRARVVQNITTTVDINGEQKEIIVPLDTYVDVPIDTEVRVHFKDTFPVTVPLDMTVEVPINKTVVVPFDETFKVPVHMEVKIEKTLQELGLGDLIDQIVEILLDVKSALGG
ncbi:hypothetical protein [Thermococcus pacificus]|uniref:Uncharacterized protein n=1 Tax=Thermococcus pacificus TaxID=71998 RepID=A0A218P860_9EURY|nr:hypothetical protein [Thermococcus pacificus]ASJ06910.1 hypothetical protein A3L08_06030 [Thermococcus pacificus]